MTRNEEADFFARAILMPKKVYKEQLEKGYLGNGRYSLEGLMKYFEMPLEDVRQRGKDLKLLK